MTRYAFLLSILVVITSLACIISTLASEEDFTNSIGMKMVWIRPGMFQMGSNECAWQTKPVHTVRITKPFYLGAHEVTIGQFKQFLQESNHDYPESELKCPKWTDEPPLGDNYPAYPVSWQDAVAFCEWLSKKEGREYRLPTEAEWEYACRAGTNTAYNTGKNTITHDDANFSGIEGRDKWICCSPMESFPPNAWGIYDMHGNIWEWCSDLWKSYHEFGSAEDEVLRDRTWFETLAWAIEFPQPGDRISRGGDWYSSAKGVCSACRAYTGPAQRFGGFRCALTYVER